MSEPLPLKPLASRLYWRGVGLAILVGWMLRIAVLDAGFFTDDYAQISMAQGVFPVPRHPLDLFTFSDGSAQDVRAMVEYGYMPWWSLENVQIALMRPLSSALIVLDTRLFGHWAPGYHLHSMLWWGLLMVSVAVVLRTVLPTRIALLALWIYALDEAHGHLIGWIANRNAVVSATFALWALFFHLRWREQGRRGAFVLSLLAFIVALSAGEMAICVLGYVAAHAVWGRGTGSLVRRLALTLPLLGLAVGYLAIHRSLGYGAYGSDMYLEPLSEPLRYLGAAAQRIPVFVGDVVTGLRAEWVINNTPYRDRLIHGGPFPPAWWRHAPDWRATQPWIGAAVLAAIVWVLRRSARAFPSPVPSTAGWLGVGSLLSMVPIVSSFPSSRLLVLAMVGGCAVLALPIAQGWHRFRMWQARRPITRGSLWIPGVLAFIHLWHAPLESRREVLGFRNLARGIAASVQELEADPEHLPGQRAILIGARDPQTSIYIPTMRAFFGLPAPRSCWPLTLDHFAHRITRPDPNTLRIRVVGGTMLTDSFELLFRTSAHPMERGHRVDLPGLQITVTKTVQGRPVEVEYRFDTPLEDERWIFWQTAPDGIDRFELPVVGERRLIPPPAIPIGPRSDG